MELWIRSQDRDILTKVEKLELIYDCLCSDEVQLIHIDSDKGSLGSYATKERALEVLDEIQKLLMPISEYKQEIDNLTINYKNIDTAIYEMPKD